MRKEIFENFELRFQNEKEVSKTMIHNFLLTFYPNMKDSSFYWNLYALKDKGYITKLNNETYIINRYKKKKMNLDITNSKLFDLLYRYNTVSLQQNYEYRETFLISMWSNSFLNNFSTHQVLKKYTFIEIDKYRIDDLYYYLKKNYQKEYITKNYKNESFQIETESEVIVILSLHKRAPLEKEELMQKHYVTVPKVEKILVDIVHEKKIFNMYDEYAIKEIYKNIYSKYNIDFTTLLYYAKNRGKRENLAKYVNYLIEGE